MNAGNRNRRNGQGASVLKAWSQLITVAIIFLLVLPRCVGCRSPVDPLIEKFYGVELNPDGTPKFDPMSDQEFQEMIRNSQR